MAPDNTLERNAAARLAATDLAQATAHARRIDDLWFKCQALAYLAAHTEPRDARDILLAEAFSLADSLREPNRVVSVSAWPLSVAARHWPDDELQRVVERLCEIIAKEPSPVRRANGLLHLIPALARRREALAAVLGPFVAACFTPLASGKHNRRGENWLLEVLPIIALYDHDHAVALCEFLHSSNKKTDALQIILEVQGKTINELRLARILP